MRSALIGLTCLAFGVLGALGYSHYLGEGRQLADLQDQLSKATGSLTKAVEDSKQAKQETDAMSAQIQQLTTTNEKLKQAASEVKSDAPAVATPANPFANMGGMMKEVMAHQSDARLLLLKSRLHLTPEQEAAVKAAMDEDSKRTQEMTAKMFAGGKIDIADYKKQKGKSVDQTLDEILNPEQKTQYQQMKTDEKNSAAETTASVEMNQMSPMLQLTDTQKDQVYNALAQNQLNSEDPNWIKNNHPSSTNPADFLDNQEKSKEDALAKILTPDQLATYHQQAQSRIDMQKAMMQKFMPQAAAAAANNAPTPAPAAPAATPASGQ